MLHTNRLFTIFVLVALILSACQPFQPMVPGAESAPAPAAQQPAAEPQPPHGLRFDAPEYAIDGPYAVGVRYFTIPAAAENDRELTVTVWYPAQQPEGATGEMIYEQQFAPGEIPSFSVSGDALLDAPPDASGAPYPLVVYSHATWSFAQEIPYLTEHLASYGFMVISADHEDNWSTAFAPAAVQALIRRPEEITREIDYAESLGAPSGDLSGMIDTTGVGVAGWSMGGEASLAVAGARWAPGGLRAWCEDDPESVEACVEKFTALAGLEEIPQGLWPSRVDERVRAVIPLSGYTTPFGSDGMQSVDVPVMFMVGSGAVATDRTFAVDTPYENVSAERKAKVVFDYGEALMFFSSCADSPSIVELGFPMFCSDPVWDMDRAHDLVNHFATAFLLAELKGDAEAATALAAENVSFPGIQYQESGYSEAPEIGSADELQPRGLRPDAPPYAVHGPFAVGTREFVIETSERTTPITVWYPALNPGGKPEAIAYRMDVGDEGLPLYPVLGNAILDAAPDLSGAPYPLVVWSHGAYLYRQTNAYLAEHLASQGFVVVAGNHEDNWGTFPAPNVTSDISRPVDISAWINFAEEQTAADSELAGLIDTERIAVGGHSYGGYTALTVAGALYNPTWYLDVVCADNTLAEDDPLNACSATEKALDELAALAGLDAVPEGLWPSRQDPRVDAIFLLAPSSVFGAEGSAPVTIPTMSLTGSDDPMQDAALHVYLTHENLGSANKSLVVFQGGGHTMFLNDCTSATGMAGVAFEWCSDSVWDTDRVHDLTNYFATAFLKAELYGDAEAATALAAENVSFPGIQYETTGYGASR